MRTIRTTTTLVLLWTMAGMALVTLAPLPLALVWRVLLGTLAGSLVSLVIWLTREPDL